MSRVEWLVTGNSADGRQFVTDAFLLLDVEYTQADDPEETTPTENVERLLHWPTDHRFSFFDLGFNDDLGHYVSPKGIVLNELYIRYLAELVVRNRLYFQGSGQYEPVLIYDDETLIGAIMPMKVEGAENNSDEAEEVRRLSDQDFSIYYELKRAGLERVLGPMHGVVGHAIIGFQVGGPVDMYYFPHAVACDLAVRTLRHRAYA